MKTLSHENYYSLGELNYLKENYEKAIQLFQKACDIRESNDCLNYIGCCYLELGDFISALRIFKNLIETCPDWERPHYNIGKTYLRQEKYDKALKYFEEAATI